MSQRPVFSAGVRASVAILFILIVGASYSKRVTRIEPSTVTDLSGRWNDTDSRLVANPLVKRTRTAGLAKRYGALQRGEAPAVNVAYGGTREDFGL